MYSAYVRQHATHLQNEYDEFYEPDDTYRSLTTSAKRSEKLREPSRNTFPDHRPRKRDSTKLDVSNLPATIHQIRPRLCTTSQSGVRTFLGQVGKTIEAAQNISLRVVAAVPPFMFRTGRVT